MTDFDTSGGLRFRDILRRIVPPWLAERRQDNKTVGYRYLWSMVAPLDAALQIVVEGLRAGLGVGTSTALPLLSRTRGLIRGEGETDPEFVEYLSTWLDKWRAAGSAEAIAGAIQHYLANHPRVRIVTRSGYWVTLETDGTITRTTQAWDWDSVSNPERAGFWSEIWIIVYPTEWSTSGPFLDTAGAPTWGADDLGIGHDVDRVAYEAILGLVAQWKAAHTKVRAMIFTSDASRFDPATPTSLPDGTWGNWGTTGSGTRVASGRDLTTCRYWEP